MLKSSLILSAMVMLAVLASQTEAEAGRKQTRQAFNAKVVSNPVTQSRRWSRKFKSADALAIKNAMHAAKKSQKDAAAAALRRQLQAEAEAAAERFDRAIVQQNQSQPANGGNPPALVTR